MYRTSQIRIRKGHRLYPFCRNICLAAAKLFNRGNYLIRQYATSVKRIENGEELTENQRTAYEMIRRVTSGTKYEPKNTWLGYGQLDFVFKNALAFLTRRGRARSALPLAAVRRRSLVL